MGAHLSLKAVPSLAKMSQLFHHFTHITIWMDYSGIILCVNPTNGRRHYIVPSSLIGFTHTQNDPCSFGHHQTSYPVASSNCIWKCTILGHISVGAWKVCLLTSLTQWYTQVYLTSEWLQAVIMMNGMFHRYAHGFGPFAFCCFSDYIISCLWINRMYYSTGLLYWPWDHHVIALVPVKYT